MNSKGAIKAIPLIFFLSVIELGVGFWAGAHYEGIHDRHIWERVESRLNGFHVVKVKPDKTYTIRCEPIGRECQEKDPLVIFEDTAGTSSTQKFR